MNREFALFCFGYNSLVNFFLAVNPPLAMPTEANKLGTGRRDVEQLWAGQIVVENHIG